MNSVNHAIFYDCEYLVSKNAHMRFWCGPSDPDPIVVQIGAVRLSLEGDFELEDTFKAFIKPVDRTGQAMKLDPVFTHLTGITEEDISKEGTSLQDALERFDQFGGGDNFWSWGKDELNLMAISCYIAGIEPTIPARRFRNACNLALAAGTPLEEVHKLRSHSVCKYYGVQTPNLRAHDGLADALSVAYVAQHLLRDGQIMPNDFGV